MHLLSYCIWRQNSRPSKVLEKCIMCLMVSTTCCLHYWCNSFLYLLSSALWLFYMNVWVIDHVWGQDGWILAKFFFCEFMDLDFVSIHKLAKKERGQYPAILTEQAWSIKDLLYGFHGKFSCGSRRVITSGQDSSILPVRVANNSAEFESSCPLTELAM